MNDKPNILFITADQWRGDCLGFLGHPEVKTPHIDMLAKSAVTFANHYSAAAPCGPSRACMYTGLHTLRNRAVLNGTPLSGTTDNIALMARRAGYTPTLFGYTDIAADPRGMDAADQRLRTYEGILPGFEVGQRLEGNQQPWKQWLRRHGYEESAIDEPYHVPQPVDQRISLEAAPFAAEHSQTAFLTEKFVDWMYGERRVAPWFAHISFIHPHPPFVAPAPYTTMYDPASPFRFAGEGSIDAIAKDHPLVRLIRDRHTADDFVPLAKGQLSDLSEEDFRRIRALYYGLISEVDAQIGHLIDALKEAGEWDNTVFILTSDHGEMMGDHGLLGKGGFYPESQHIPLMIAMPGVDGGRTVDTLTSAVDLYPTLAEITQADMAHDPNGHSLLPLAAGGESSRDAVIWEFDFRDLVSADWRNEHGVSMNGCNMIARLSDSVLFVHSPAFAPIAFDLRSDPECLVDALQKKSGDTLRGQLYEALCADLLGLRDETLTDIKLSRTGVRRLSDDAAL